jgi:DNA-binding sugar fermentation-stimulating protein
VRQTTVRHNTTATPTLLDGKLVLFSLQDPDPLIRATLRARPSTRNKSPYVADVRLDGEDGREALLHVPNLDMGGKCVVGKTLLIKPARTNKGELVGAEAVSPKYQTPKCEFHAQLLYVDEQEYTQRHPDPPTNGDIPADDDVPEKIHYPPTWVGAHPALGERIARCWLEHNLVEGIPAVTALRTQVRNPCGTDMRVDFLVTHADHTQRIIEVKTVVDTDYAVDATPPAVPASGKRPKKSCVFVSHVRPYTRTAIFPWGNSNQKGPDGEAVVSTRAIHHVRELTRIARERLCWWSPSEEEEEEVKVKTTSTPLLTTILFVVIRGDATAFAPNIQACPSFARYLREAHDAGVQVLAKRVRWGVDEHEGVCVDDDMLPIVWPTPESRREQSP